ncbi:kinetochore protein [Trema orientale]|uniref:Kinetochore protein n=1 Tax=Trema orientale TaxID=63057 RepID=A0A2P5FFQ6_TREOI|nr:kinetochore protein [Trema orientale]
MWGQGASSTTPTANPESDQSISDEDDFAQDWPENCVSLAPSADKKERLEISSRLELLQGLLESGTKTSNLSNAKPTSSTFEDDVEIPEFCDEGDFIDPPKRVIPEGEAVGTNDLLGEGKNVLSKVSANHGAETFAKDVVLGFGTEKQEDSYSWSAVSKEAEALMDTSEHASCYSKPKKSVKGVKGKGKPKFSFGVQLHKDRLSSPCTSKDESNLSIGICEVPERLNQEHIVAELPEDIQGEEENLPEIVPFEVEAVRHACSEQSMAELLDGLQDNVCLLRRNSKKFSSKRGKRLQLVVKRNLSPLGDRTVNNEYSPNRMGSSGSSSDSEMSGKDLELAIPQMKRQAIVDQFHEALGANFLDDNVALHTVPKPPRSGLFWKLQQVMQSEKERDMDFLKKLETGVRQNEPSCIYVKILARYLEGKLTVCHCLFSKNSESLSSSEPHKEVANERMKRTIIFNPRVCNDVDLEVGNCICIHPPWKEVQVGNDKSIILATYFCNFQLTSSDFPVGV